MALLQALLTTCPPSPALTTFGKPRVAGKSSSYTILFRRFLKMLGEGGESLLEPLQALVVRDQRSFEIQGCRVHRAHVHVKNLWN